MNRSGKIHALLSTARVANIPSVASNVWLGVAVGIALNHTGWEGTCLPSAIPWRETSLLMLAGVSLYVAGNFLNDWMDRVWDAQNRPERALPRGLFAPSSYRNIALVLGAIGVASAAGAGGMSGAMAVVLAACIVIYTIWHKRAAWSVVPMGLCRAILPVMGAVGMIHGTNHPLLLRAACVSGVAGFALFCHIAGLSLSARNEARGGEQVTPVFWFLIPPVSLGVMSFQWMNAHLLSIIGTVPYGLWIWRCRTVCRRPVPRYVSALLAGIPLVDWILLMPGPLAGLAGSGSIDPLSAASLTIPPLAFVLALLLQRIAPAT